MLGSLILYLKGMRIRMFQLSGSYCIRTHLKEPFRPLIFMPNCAAPGRSLQRCSHLRLVIPQALREPLGSLGSLGLRV